MEMIKKREIELLSRPTDIKSFSENQMNEMEIRIREKIEGVINEEIRGAKKEIISVMQSSLPSKQYQADKIHQSL